MPRGTCTSMLTLEPNWLREGNGHGAGAYVRSGLSRVSSWAAGRSRRRSSSIFLTFSPPLTFDDKDDKRHQSHQPSRRFIFRRPVVTTDPITTAAVLLAIPQ